MAADEAVAEVDFSGWYFPEVPGCRPVVKGLPVWAENFKKETVFTSDASFDRATFYGDVWFEGVKFMGAASFLRANFSGDAYFKDVSFNSVARFDQAEFNGQASFLGAKFSDWPTFKKATFSRSARFDGTAFNNHASFDGATFCGKGLFNNAKFNGHVWFDEATFRGDASFESVKFSGPAWFKKVTFSREARFDGATFSIYAGFDGATFRGRASFFGAIYNPGTAVRFDQPTGVYHRRPFRHRRDGESAYRLAKLSAQQAGDYAAAGNYHYAEQRAIEDRRWNQSGLRPWRIAFWLWLGRLVFGRIVFGYGEKPWHSLVVGAAVIVICAVLYWELAAIAPGNLTAPAAAVAYRPDIGEAAYFSLVTFTTLGYGDFQPKPAYRLWAGAEAMLGAAIMAVFVVCLTRKYMR